MHPLVVHFAVVLLPLAAIMLIVLFFVPKWRRGFGWLTMAGLVVGTVAAFVAKQTGEAFALHVGLPEDHALWGDALVVVAVILVIVAGAWFWQLRSVGSRVPKGRAPVLLATGVLAIVLAAAATLMTVVVGHSGATAVWEGRLDPVQAPEVSTSAPASPGATAAPTTKTIALTEVGQHATTTSCWAAVNGKVYDLTKWVSTHPGGSSRILGMCGKDATGAFQGQHKGSDPAVGILGNYLIGSLG
ncbi:MAG: cytochrome b5 domain-containing protein [Propionicimonas sp.]